MTHFRKRKAILDGRGLIAGVLCGVLLVGCIHAAPPMLDAHTAEISGSATTGRSANDATEIVLFKAAAMTLDHGFRYFQIVGTDNVVADRSGNELIRPGANVTIKLYRQGEIDPRSTGIVDAEYIAENDQKEILRMQAHSGFDAPPRSSANAAAPVPAATPPTKSGMPTPHCTVYGCTW
jgi:hypothetical protein